MKEIIIQTQKELDDLDKDYDGYIYIEGGTFENPLILRVKFEQASVITRGKAVIEMRGSSQVKEMRESSQVKEMRGSSQVKEMRESSQVKEMWESSQVKEMRESSQVNVMRGSSQVKEMRESSQVKEMWGSSQVKEMWGSSQVKEMWGSSQVNVMRESSQVKEMRESSQVKEMWGSSQVKEMWESSQVNVMRESSQVKEMRESSQVKEMWGSSQVKEMWGSSQVNVMRESSQVKEMRGSSQVKEMWGEAMVSAYGIQRIICHGYNIVRTSKENNKNLSLVINNTSHLIVIPDFEPTFEDYQKRYPVEVKDGFATMYKAVRVRNGKYVSDRSSSFEYEVGKKKENFCDPNIENSCSQGLHISHKLWALDFGRHWSDMALLECSVPVDKIVVSKDCDGKVRTSELMVIREIPQEEWYN